MKAKHERILHPYDDVQLWFAEADDKSWMLPLHVEWHEDRDIKEHYARVTPAGICFYPTQTIVINALLQFHDIMGRPNQWVIQRRMCEALLRKAPGITALRYYRWPGEAIPPIETKPPVRTTMQPRGLTPYEKIRGNDPKRRSFVEWLAKDSKLPSSIINAVLNAVSSGAPAWMLIHRKPVDLGFCRLIAVPFRANWKEIVAFKAKASGIKLRSIFKLPHAEATEALEECGLPAMMASPHNVGLRRGWKKNGANGARIDYTLEAIASVQFEFAANRIEGQRNARGPASYVAEFEDAVEAVYETAVHALRAYLKKVGAPFADVLSRRGSSGIGFVPVSGRQVAVRGTPLGNLPVHIVGSDTRFSVWGRSSDKRLLPPPPPDVPAVSDPVPPVDDLRERTVNADLEFIGNEGDDRVRLCDVPEGSPAGESVLVSGETAGDGVAKGDPVI